MFKRLRDRIAEEVKLPVGQDLITLSESSSVVVPHTSLQQFSIGEDEDGSMSEQSTPQKRPSEASNGSESTTPREDGLGTLFDFHKYRPTKSHYQPQSDIESGREDPPTLNLDGISKEQLLRMLDSMKARVYKYKNKYSEVVKNYKEMREEKLKIENTLIEHQDKSLRRMGELREQCQLEQKAKADLDANLRLMLEEKDSRISVLETQNNLLKEGGNADGVKYSPDRILQSSDPSAGDMLVEIDTHDNSMIQEKIERLEHQHSQAKKTITAQTDQIGLLRKQTESLTQELEDKINKLNEMEEEHTGIVLSLQARLVELEKSQEETVMSMAETKRSMHEEMELKERQLAKAEEEAKTHKTLCESEKLQVADLKKLHEEKVSELERHLESTENKLEEEKQNIMQELNRGKSAALAIVKEESAKKISEMEEKLKNLQSGKESLSGSKVEKSAVKLKELEDKFKMSEDRVKELNNLALKFEKENVTLKKSVENHQTENLQTQYNDSLKGMEDKLGNVEKNYITQVDEMKSHISLLEEEKSILKADKEELSQLQNKFSSLKSEESKIRSQLKTRENEIKSLQQRLDTTSKELATKIQDVLATKEEFKTQHEKFESSSKNQVAKVQESLLAKEEDLKNLKQMYETSTNEQMAKILSYQETTKDKDNMILKLKTNIESLNKENSEKEAEMKKKVKALEEEREQLMFQAQERVAKCREDIKSMAEANSKLQETINKLEEENKEMEKLNTKFSLLEEQLQESRNHSQCIETSANREISQLKKLLEETDKKVSEAEKKKKSIESELSGKVKKLQEENSLLFGTSNHVESLKTEKEELNEKLKRVQQQVTTVQQLETEKETLRTQNAAILGEMEHLKSTLQETKTLQEETRVLHEKVKQLETTKESLSTENISIMEEMKQLRTTLKQTSLLQENQKLLELELESLKKENTNLSEDLERLKTSQSDSAHLLETIKSLEDGKSAIKIKFNKALKEKEKLQDEMSMQNEASESEKNSLKTQNENLLKQIALLEKFDSRDEDSTSMKDYVAVVKADCQTTMRLKEEEMETKLKHLVRDFCEQMDIKDKDSDKLVSELIEKNHDIEERLMKEHQVDISTMRQSLFEKECALDEMRDHYEETLQAKDKKLKEYETNLKGLPSSNDVFQPAVETSDWDDTWVVPDEAIENTSPNHSTVPCSEHQQQIEQLNEELSQCNSEIKDLKLLLGLSPPETLVNNNNRRDSLQSLPEPTEFEYLKNIIFEYMMGKEPITLAKVIAAVLRFSDAQTQQVIRREEARHPTK